MNYNINNLHKYRFNKITNFILKLKIVILKYKLIIKYNNNNYNYNNNNSMQIFWINKYKIGKEFSDPIITINYINKINNILLRIINSNILIIINNMKWLIKFKIIIKGYIFNLDKFKIINKFNNFKIKIKIKINISKIKDIDYHEQK